MMRSDLRRGLLVLCVLLAPVRMHAADLYVSTNGTPSGPGTLEQPYDLRTALSGEAGQAGDTFWLRGGNYRLGHLETRIQGEPGKPITFRQMREQRARVEGSISFFESRGYVIVRDIEIYSSDTNRASAQTGVGFEVTDIEVIPGIASYAPNLAFINLVIHDHTRDGIYISHLASNNLVYGCLAYNNGWFSPDNADGHGLHVQGTNGLTEVADNVAFNNAGASMHIYENAIQRRLAGLTLDGNVAFHAGTIQNVRAYRDWIVGVDPPGANADDIVLRNNMGYYAPGSLTLEQVQIGRHGVNGIVALLNNYWPQGLWMNNWTTATVKGNVLATHRDNLVNLNQTQVSLEAVWDDNTYLRLPTGQDFLINSNSYDFSGWQSATGYDQNSTYTAGDLSGTKIFVRPNRYEPGRANIIVYNWDNRETVTVDVSSLLAPGATYEVRNAQDFFAAPVLSGVFDGQPLELPMTGLTVAAPNGPLLTPPPTGPTFNVFILLSRFVRLQIAAVDGQLEISWPVSSGHWILQFSESLSGNEGWLDDTNTPAIRQDQYVVTSVFSESARFYRLRAVH
jgi:hypothetical protein